MDDTYIIAQKTLAQQGCRWTVPRREVISVFMRYPLPLTVAEVYRRLHDRQINLVSVYRAIHLFCRLGILTAVDQVDEGRRYELSDGYLAHHHHLICEACGAIQDFEGCFLAEFERQVSRATQFRITRHELRFFGLCQACSS